MHSFQLSWGGIKDGQSQWQMCPRHWWDHWSRETARRFIDCTPLEPLRCCIQKCWRRRFPRHSVNASSYLSNMGTARIRLTEQWGEAKIPGKSLPCPLFLIPGRCSKCRIPSPNASVCAGNAPMPVAAIFKIDLTTAIHETAISCLCASRTTEPVDPKAPWNPESVRFDTLGRKSHYLYA